MMLGLLVLGAAWAATWTPPQRLSHVVDAQGLLLLPAGVALRLDLPARGAWPTVTELSSVRNPDTGELMAVPGPGVAVDGLGVPEGLLIPRAPDARLLRVDGADRRLRVRLTTRREQSLAWQRAMEALMRPEGLDDLDLPWGGPERLASTRLRARAVSDPAVLRLGLAHDLGPILPVTRSSHQPPVVQDHLVPAGEQVEVELEGPAILVLGLRPIGEGSWTRSEVEASLDGAGLDLLPLASSGGTLREERLYLGPDRHLLRIGAPEAGVHAQVEVLRPRASVWPDGLPPVDHRAEEPFDQAELDWLMGRRAQAARAFLAWADAAGPQGDLARARLIEAESDAIALLERAAIPGSTSPDGVVLSASALLRRAEQLPPALVEAAVARTDRLDPALIARWIDTLGGTRSRGTGLLAAAMPLVDSGEERPGDLLRHRSVHTRFTLLTPEPVQGGETPHPVEVSDRGPGVPRVELDPGQPLSIELAAWDGRSPVLRMRVVETARWTIDGQPWEAHPGELRVALEAGAHELRLESGRLLLMDPEVAPAGRTVWERAPTLLPAEFELPDPGARTDLRLDLDPPVPVLASFDDGSLHRLDPDAQGELILPVGTRARRVSLRPLVELDEPARAVLQLRARLPDSAPLPPDPVPDLDQAILDLEYLSRAVDSGDPWPRLHRAALLGRMGQISAARRDLLVLLESEDSLLRREAWALAHNLSPATTSASALGPLDGASALAARQDLRPLPAQPPEARALVLVAAARDHQDDRDLWRAAALEWIETDRLADAWMAALMAGSQGEAIRQTILGRTGWTLLAWPTEGEGLVTLSGEEVPEEPTVALAEWQRVRQALLASPWPLGPEAEGAPPTVLRGELREVVKVGPGTLTVELFCRDEVGPGRACEVTLRVLEATRTLTVADGETVRVDLGPSSAARELEVSGPGPGLALVSRVLADGAAVRGITRVSAHRAGPTPLVYQVAGPTLARVDVLRGRARVEVQGVEQDEIGAGERLVLPILGQGPQTLRVLGSADVRVYLGQRLPESAAPEGALAAALAEDGSTAAAIAGLDPAGLLAAEIDRLAPEEPLPVDIDALFARFSTPPLPQLRAPGGGGSVELSLSAHAETLSYPSERWEAVQLAGRYLKASPRSWAQAGGWVRGPSPTGGALVEGGRSNGWGWLGARAFGAAANSVTGPAGQLGAQVHGQAEGPLTTDLALRLDGRVRGTWQTGEPVARVDWRAWSRWHEHHPLFGALALSLIGDPFSELRWWAGLRAVSNTGPSLDRVGAGGGADLMLRGGLVLGLDASVEHRFADEHREGADLGARVDLAVEHGFWDGQRRWWRPWLRAGWPFTDSGPVASIGVDLLLGPARGLRDLPPGSLAFRPLRELP